MCSYVCVIIIRESIRTGTALKYTACLTILFEKPLFQNLNVRFDTVRFVLNFELSNLQSMIIEIVIGGVVLGGFFFWLQDRASKNTEKVINKIAELTQQKATAEQKHKEFECKRIIEHLQGIEQTELGLKQYLENYKVGTPTTDLKFYARLSVQPITHNINMMKDAMEQLQGKLNDDSLRHDFLNYVGAFNVLPKWILVDDVPQQEHQLQGLLDYADLQMKKIENFIERFKKEMDSR